MSSGISSRLSRFLSKTSTLPDMVRMRVKMREKTDEGVVHGLDREVVRLGKSNEPRWARKNASRTSLGGLSRRGSLSSSWLQHGSRTECTDSPSESEGEASPPEVVRWRTMAVEDGCRRAVDALAPCV